MIWVCSVLFCLIGLLAGLVMGWRLRGSARQAETGPRITEYVQSTELTEPAGDAVWGDPGPNAWLLVLTDRNGGQTMRTMRETPPEYYLRPHGKLTPTRYMLMSVEDHQANYIEVA